MMRFVVVSGAVLGTVLIATSQPCVNASQQGKPWPEHHMIPGKIGLNQVQEFKDAASLHLNDVQNYVMYSAMKGSASRCIFTETIVTNYINRFLVVVGAADVSKGGAASAGEVKKLTPAEIAMLTYTFDEGIEMISRNGASATVSPSGIEAKITPKDMGMTSAQLRQMTSHYIENHPMRYWNEARVGLASGR